jgi:hypothetical protein
LGTADKGGDVPKSTEDRLGHGPDAYLIGRATRHPAPLVGILPKGVSVIRRIVSLLMVTAMLLATMVAPAFADSTRVCNNRCGDVDQSTDIDNSQDNDTTINDNDTTNLDNSVTNDNDTTNNIDNNTTNNIDNSVTNDNDTTINDNDTTKTCGTISGNNSSCNIS